MRAGDGIGARRAVGAAGAAGASGVSAWRAPGARACTRRPGTAWAARCTAATRCAAALQCCPVQRTAKHECSHRAAAPHVLTCRTRAHPRALLGELRRASASLLNGPAHPTDKTSADARGARPPRGPSAALAPSPAPQQPPQQPPQLPPPAAPPIPACAPAGPRARAPTASHAASVLLPAQLELKRRPRQTASAPRARPPPPTTSISLFFPTCIVLRRPPPPAAHPPTP